MSERFGGADNVVGVDVGFGDGEVPDCAGRGGWDVEDVGGLLQSSGR